MVTRMHADEIEIDERLVRQLLDLQMPQYRSLPLSTVSPWGTDHAIYRLGPELVVRLARIHWAAQQSTLEERWLSTLRARLSVNVPEVVAMGDAALGYPYRWSVHRWIEGELASRETIIDANRFASCVAGAIDELRRTPIEGAPAPRHRARALKEYDREARRAIGAADHLLDAAAALAIWNDAVDAPIHDARPTWVHGDLDGNCLVRHGELTAIIDWGSMCAGDPAVDVAVIWSELFTLESRRRFLEWLDVDEATVRRSRGVALSQACAALPYYQESYPEMVRRSLHKLRALGVATSEG